MQMTQQQNQPATHVLRKNGWYIVMHFSAEVFKTQKRHHADIIYKRLKNSTH